MRSVQQTQSDQPEVQLEYKQQVMFELQVVCLIIQMALISY